MKNEKLHDVKKYLNVREMVETVGRDYRDRIAFSYKVRPSDEETVKVSFYRLRSDVRALATEMIAQGCRGKHCAIIAKPSYEWALVYFAALSIGSVLVPLDREWGGEELSETMRTADAEFLFIDGDIAEKGDFIAEKTGLKSAPVYLGGTARENTVTLWLERGRDRFEESSREYYHAPIDPEKLALLVFTSGTTGKGKGVMLSQKAILEDVCAVIPYIDFGRKTLSVLPLHHTFGSSVMLMGHAIIGSEVYISSGLRYIQKELQEEKPSHLVVVPLYLENFYRKIYAKIRAAGKESLIKTLIKVSNGARFLGIDARKQLFKSVQAAFGGQCKTVICGGAPINPDIIRFFESVGVAILNGYGITECAPVVAVNRSRHVVAGSVGTVVDIDDVRIEDPNEDDEGEILVKGPNVMLGYYKNEEATRDAMTEDGYFRTGDYGKLTGDNILTITGRKKNLIILSNGKNVYPEEIENQLVSVPGIETVIVYEGQSKRGMEHNAIVAEIYPDYDYIEKNGVTDLKAYFKPYIDEYNKTAVSYKKIQLFKIRQVPFPTNTLRKIIRFKIDMSIK